MKPILFSPEYFTSMNEQLQKGGYGQWLYHRILDHAEWTLRQNIPACPPPGPMNTQKSTPPQFGESTYSDEYLLVHEAFDTWTPVFESVVLTLGVAWRLTEDNRYKARLDEWVDIYLNEWDAWGPQAHPCDQFAVRIMIGMAYYGMLAGDRAAFDVRETVKKWFDLTVNLLGGRENLKKDQIWHIGNHSWFNLSMTGITALFLGDTEMADICAERVGNLTEWAIGEDGDYLDKPHYILFALRYATPFFYLYEYLRTEPPVNWEKVRRALWFAVDIDPAHCYIAPYLLSASRSHDSQLQYMAEQLNFPPLRPLPEPILTIMSDIPYSCLFYDPDVAPVPPAKKPAARHYRATGYAVCGPLTTAPEAKVVFYAGPHSGKSSYEQGVVALRFLGEELLRSEPLTTNNTYISEHRMAGHYNSNLSDLVAHIDGLGQCAGIYPLEWPDTRYTGHEVQPPLCRMLSVCEDAGVFSAEADITGAYAVDKYDFTYWGQPTVPPDELKDKDARRAQRFLRRVRLTPDNVLTVQDEIVFTDGKTPSADIFFCTGNIEILSPTRARARVGRAAFEVEVDADQPFTLSAQTYFASERSQRLGVHFAPGASTITCTCRFSLHSYKDFL